VCQGLKQVAVSSGSACTSSTLEVGHTASRAFMLQFHVDTFSRVSLFLFLQPSYVLRAIGVGEDLAHTSIRFGIGRQSGRFHVLSVSYLAGRFTTEEEVDRAIELTYK
jgi:cysteine sulfinate desulfinase/cysteine desulfurase-like protein